MRGNSGVTVKMPSSYALVTPARDEAENLRRLAASVLEQTIRPAAWVIVDNGSTDETPALVAELGRTHPWITAIEVEGESAARPGAPIVRAFHAGLAALPAQPHVVVKLDADVSLPSDHFEKLLEAFAADPSLGIASGGCYEEEGGGWQERHVTAGHVRGAARAYRWECLRAVLPLEERVGWDGIDELKANVLGWKTGIVPDLPFYHHRSVGERDGSRFARWRAQGQGAHYMGYRFTYLMLRAVHRSVRDPAALAMISAYVAAALRREPRNEDAAVRAYLRKHQSLRRLPLRAREALGKRVIP
jgi:biofilm PGA synthesis N-glycosyltransferase PgaC